MYALLTDGSTAEIAPARPQDFEAVRAMHAAMSPDNIYLRFFSMSPNAAEQEARRVCRKPDSGRAALLAWQGDRLVGVGSYESDGTSGVEAEEPPATWTRISRTATCPRKALVTTRETCRSAGHGLRGVARPSEGASPRLAAVNNPDRLHPQRRIRDSMIPHRGQHQFSTRSGNVRD